jgi:hypothetical protein
VPHATFSRFSINLGKLFAGTPVWCRHDFP